MSINSLGTNDARPTMNISMNDNSTIMNRHDVLSEGTHLSNCTDSHFNSSESTIVTMLRCADALNSTNFTNFGVFNEARKPWPSDAELTRLLVLSSIFCMVAVLANLVSIFAIRHIPGTLTGNHLLYCNLSVSDLFGAIAAYMEVVALANFSWNTSDDHSFVMLSSLYTRIIGSTVFVFLYFASALTLLGFAVLRFTAIFYPMKYQEIFVKRTVGIIICIVWVVSAALALPTLCLLKMTYIGKGFCMHWDKIWPSVIVAISLIIICLYIAVYIESRRARERAFHTSPGQVCETTNHYKAFVTTILLLITLALSCLPYTIVKLLRLIVKQKHRILRPLYTDFIIFLPFVNFATDPIIIALRTRDIREGYSRMFRKFAKLIKCNRRMDSTVRLNWFESSVTETTSAL